MGGMTDRTAVTPSVAAGSCVQRRALLAAVPGVVLLPGVLSACGMTEPAQPASTVQSTTSVPSTTIPAAEIPVGTAKTVRAGEATVIVAQPAEGEFVAYSARCTHQGGTVQVVKDLHLRCPLHGAEFDATTGENTGPPAPRPLDSVPVKESGGQLTLG